MSYAEILIVEDLPKQRAALASVLEGEGILVRSAAGYDDAIAIYERHVSTIGAVVADIRLDDNDIDDKSGINLAKDIKSMSPRLPVYTNSAHDNLDEEIDFVDFRFVKATPEDKFNILKNTEKIVAAAKEYDENRYKSVPGELLKLRDKYDISPQDFTKLLSAWRLSDIQKTAVCLVHQSIHEADTEVNAPIKEHMNLQFIQPSKDSETLSKLTQQIPVFMSKENGYWVAELFGFPMIYTYSNTRDNALNNLVDSVYELHCSLNADKVECTDQRADYLRLRSYLSNVFEESN